MKIENITKSLKKYIKRKLKKDKKGQIAPVEASNSVQKKYINYESESFYNTQDIRFLLSTNKYRGVYVMGSLCLGWFDKMKQRHQHIAEYMMDEGYLVICGINPIHNADYTPTAKRINNNLILVNFYNRALWHKIIESIGLGYDGYKFYHMIGTEPGTTMDEIKWLKSIGFTVNYEISDDLSPEIFSSIDSKILERHEEILKDKAIVVVTTAEKLYKKAIKYRKENVVLSPNAAKVSDWVCLNNKTIPVEIEEIVRKKKKIVGFYGSFAAWIDYDYIKYISEKRPEYEIVMIGYDYENGEGAFVKSGIADLKNVNIIDAKPYNQLKYYSQFFDVAIIPFRKYDLTETVSPVKMFEHMAQRIPVVTTDMYECRKYPVVFVSENKEDFIKNIDRAINLKFNKDFSEQLYQCAINNSWDSRGAQILKFLESTQIHWMNKVKSGKKLLSIVIPTYNMERYLHRCIDTLCHNSMASLLEIIIVNDGSMDKSYEFAKYYENLYPKTVKVINKENGGHGSCLNVGIKYATGKYFKIVDSDDYLDSISLLQHLVYLSKCESDVIVTNYNRFYNDSSIESVSYCDRLSEGIIYSSMNFYQAMLKDSSFTSYAHMHSITYSTKLLKNCQIKITEKSFYVDQEYITYPLKNAKTFSYQNIYLYHYFLGRPGQSVDPELARKRSYMNLNIIKNIQKYMDTLEESYLISYLENILFHQTSYWLECSDDEKSKKEQIEWWKRRISDKIKINSLIKLSNQK